MTSTRALRAPAATDEWPRTPARKDKKRWCGGHVGRVHQPVVVKDKNLTSFTDCHIVEARRDGIHHRDGTVWSCIHHTVCSVCGRTIEWVWGNTPCPDKPEGVPYGWPKENLNDPAE